MTTVTQDLIFKYVVVGDSGVGKSCLVDQFTQRQFHDAHLTTIGVSMAEVTRSIRVNGCEMKIEVWDTGGMEVYRSLTTAYYRNSAVTILVYDITRRNTFENLVGWLNEIRAASNNSHMLVMVVGNKIDLMKERQVSRQEGQQFASQNKIFFMETSAKIKETVEKVFFLTARVYYEKIDMGDIDVRRHALLHGVKFVNEPDQDEMNCSENSNPKRSQRFGCSC